MTTLPTPPLPTSVPGFAKAVQPIAHTTEIKTDSEGLEVGDIKIATSNGEIPGYFAKPIHAGSYPIVLVVQEIFGVHEHIRDVTRRLAKLGYLAVAPELFYRQGSVANLQIEAIREIVARVPDAQVLTDLDATLAWAETHGGDSKRIAISGFCWGGRITWLYAAHQPKLKAGVAWYGRLDSASTELQPHSPLSQAEHLKVPVLGLYGGADTGIPLETVHTFQAALAAVNSPSTVHIYPDAPHAFYADYRPSYRKEAAEDGWQRLKTWLKQHGV